MTYVARHDIDGALVQMYVDEAPDQLAKRGGITAFCAVDEVSVGQLYHRRHGSYAQGTASPALPGNRIVVARYRVHTTLDNS